MDRPFAPMPEERSGSPHSHLRLTLGEFGWTSSMPPPLSAIASTWSGYLSSDSPQAGQISPGGSVISTACDSQIGSPTCQRQDGPGYIVQDEAFDPTRRPSVSVKLEEGDIAETMSTAASRRDTFLVENTQPKTFNGPQKRPRGRPRKHPVVQPLPNAAKSTKGRSKTGCITCRKRKKKCDETKPKCMNCEKNAVVCEGYHEKQLWKSGKERTDERVKTESFEPLKLQSIFDGVETAEDKLFWSHYVNRLSTAMTLDEDGHNVFNDTILHLANQHQGLMHSILAVSGAHINSDTINWTDITRKHPSLTHDVVERQTQHHRQEALKFLFRDMEQQPEDCYSSEYQMIMSARYAQILCLLLQTIVDGNTQGEHRLHLLTYQSLIREAPPQDSNLRSFVVELFQYSICADDLLWHPCRQKPRLANELGEFATLMSTPRLFGITDELLLQLPLINELRNTIRSNIMAGIEPVAGHTVLSRAAEIDGMINSWQPPPAFSSIRRRIAMLYRQSLWLYLYRTIHPPSMRNGHRSITGSLAIAAPTEHRRASITSSVASSPATLVFSPGSCCESQATSRNSSIHDADCVSTPSDPSTGTVQSVTAMGNDKIQTSVNHSLDILESFNAEDAAQTVLLIPCLLVGTSCFESSQRTRLRGVTKAVHEYTGVGSCKRVSELLDEVWRRMDQGDWMGVWDWQVTAMQMELDFLCK